MPKGQNLCPECGTPAKEPYKTWELIAPFPDKNAHNSNNIRHARMPQKRRKIPRRPKQNQTGSEGIQL